MRIWIIEAGEHLPVDKGKGRLWRTGLLTEILYARGHEITWWASTFSHSHKTQRFKKDTVKKYKKFYRIFLLHAISYKKNVGIRRIINHRIIAKKFLKYAAKELKPDLIYCCLPTLDFCSAATTYGYNHDIPVVIDIRDMWPDIMVDVFPGKIKFLGKILLAPLFKNIKRTCSRASAIIGVNPVFVKIGLAYAKRKKSFFDKDFPLAYPSYRSSDAEYENAKLLWKDLLESRAATGRIICFFGTLSKRMELRTLIKASFLMEERRPNQATFVICGMGEMEKDCKLMTKNAENIFFPGWVGAGEIHALMQLSSVGIIPYPSSIDFSANYPNKAIEYLAGGLPIISSIKGVLEEFLIENDCGVTYANKNPEDLVDKLCWLFDDSKRLERMSINSYSVFKEKFRAEKVYKEMAEHIEFVAKKVT